MLRMLTTLRPGCTPWVTERLESTRSVIAEARAGHCLNRSDFALGPPYSTSSSSLQASATEPISAVRGSTGCFGGQMWFVRQRSKRQLDELVVPTVWVLAPQEQRSSITG
jgi:hypothetical protein